MRTACLYANAILLATLAGGCSLVLAPSLPVDSLQDVAFNAQSPIAASVEAEGEPVFFEQAVFTAIPGKQGSHAAAVTAFEDGELLAAWYSYDGPGELDGSAIYMARWLADEQAWSEPWVHIDHPESDGNPVLYAEGDKTWFFQSVTVGGWALAHIETQMSENRGRTWSSSEVISGPLGSNTRFPPVRMQDGALLLPGYSDLFSDTLFWISEDDRDWRLLGGVSVAPAAIQPSVVQLPDGRLLAVMRNAGGGFLWVMSSGDEGHSWSLPADSGFPNPGAPSALLKLASGHLLLVFNDSATDRVPLSVALSADDGLTWPVRRILADGDTTYSYPATVQAADGLIHVLFSLGRERIEHAAFNEAWVVGDGD